MKTIYRFLLFAIVCLFGSNVSYAQEQFANIQEGDYYIYTVDRDRCKYISSGGSRGTRATMSDVGLPYHIKPTGEEGCYILKTNIGGENNSLAPHTYYNDGSGEWEIVQENGKYEIRTYNSQLSTYDCMYTSLYGNANNGEGFYVAGELMDWQSWGASLAIWQLATSDDLKSCLEGATQSNPVDATVYISAPDFLTGDSRTGKAWKGDFTVGGDTREECRLFNNSNAEVKNTGTFDVYQEITDLPNGIYKLTAQAFYREGDAGEASADAYKNGTEILPQLYANENSIDIESVYSQAFPLNPDYNLYDDDWDAESFPTESNIICDGSKIVTNGQPLRGKSWSEMEQQGFVHKFETPVIYMKVPFEVYSQNLDETCSNYGGYGLQYLKKYGLWAMQVDPGLPLVVRVMNTGFLTPSGDYMIPDNQAQAAACFEDNEYYPNGVYLNTIDNIVVTDGKLRIGIRRNGEAVNDWTVFDRFRLTYYGPTESETSYDVDGDGSVTVADVNKVAGVILGRETDTLNRSDIDGNGKTEISDVTKLIEKLQK